MLGNVFMTDTDGNIRKDVSNLTEKVCGLLFDISAHSNIWSSGAGAELAETWQDNVIELNSIEDAIQKGLVPYTGETETIGEAPNQTTVSTDFLAGIPYFHIDQFFKAAGGSGRLFVYFADCSSNWNALIDMQRAAKGIINQFGVWTEQNLWTHFDTSKESYSPALIQDIQTTMKSMADNYFSPASCLLVANTSTVKQASAVSKTVVFSKIPDLKALQSRYVSVLLSQSMDPTVKAMQASLESTTPVGTLGLALGCLTVANVGESIGWVGGFNVIGYVPDIEFGFGNATVTNGALTNATAYSALTKPQLDELDTKGYIFMCIYEGLESGVYFNKDNTCSDGDYCTISRNRAINKSRRSIRTQLLPYVNSPVKVATNGQLTPAQQTVYKNLIVDVLQAMVDAEEISQIGKVDIPLNQNILVTKKLKFSYTFIPLGCAESIEVTEGLAISQ